MCQVVVLFLQLPLSSCEVTKSLLYIIDSCQVSFISQTFRPNAGSLSLAVMCRVQSKQTFIHKQTAGRKGREMTNCIVCLLVCVQLYGTSHNKVTVHEYIIHCGRLQSSVGK